MICSPQLNKHAHLFFNHSHHHQNAAIMGLVRHLLAVDGRGNLQTYCPQFCYNHIYRKSHRLHCWDPAVHLRFVNPCNLGH